MQSYDTKQSPVRERIPKILFIFKFMNQWSYIAFQKTIKWFYSTDFCFSFLRLFDTLKCCPAAVCAPRRKEPAGDLPNRSWVTKTSFWRFFCEYLNMQFLCERVTEARIKTKKFKQDSREAKSSKETGQRHSEVFLWMWSVRNQKENFKVVCIRKASKCKFLCILKLCPHGLDSVESCGAYSMRRERLVVWP